MINPPFGAGDERPEKGELGKLNPPPPVVVLGWRLNIFPFSSFCEHTSLRRLYAAPPRFHLGGVLSCLLTLRHMPPFPRLSFAWDEAIGFSFVRPSPYSFLYPIIG